MDVMTAKMRAFKFKQRKLKKNKENVPIPSMPVDMNIDNNIKLKDITSSDKNKEIHKTEEILKGEVKQKNVQLRTDQIKSLREFTFKSGDLKGSQLNESQIIRAALDLFFALNIDPSSVETEEELLVLAKKTKTI